MRITLKQLRVFDRVASLGSITKAADALGVTPSTASAALKELQASLKRPPLFHRNGRNLEISAEGLRMQPIIRTLLLQAEEIEDPSEGAELTGTVSIGSGGISENVVPALAAGFRRLHPRVRVNITCGHTYDITSLLSRFAIDAMITSSLTRAPGAYLTEIYRERSVIVAGSGHPLTALAAPSFADLADAEWCMPVRTTLSNQRMMEALRGHLANFKVAMEINSDAAIGEAVVEGGGIACLPFDVVKVALAGGRLVELKVEGFEALRPIFFVRMANVQRSAAARAFDDYVIENAIVGMRR